MAVGYIDCATLAAIGDAIRAQNGTGALYRPGEMAAAVAALDGTREGEPVFYPSGDARGIVSERVFQGIADAIRAQNGSTERYTPGEMPGAILALTWDTGLKGRAVLTADGTLEYNYLDGRRSVSGSGGVVDAWEVPAAGFSKQSERGWDPSETRAKVKRVVVDASWPGLGLANADYLFQGLYEATEVRGFENMAGATSFKHAFVSCSKLETIYATAFDPTGVTGPMAVAGLNRLVGGTGYVPTQSEGAGALKLGDKGVLTDPAADARTWVWGAVYSDGALEVSASPAVEAGREVLAHGRACTIANYRLATGLPWGEAKGSFSRVVIKPDMEAVQYLNMDYWFYSHTGIASVEGLGHLKHVFDMAFCFASCTGLTELDMRGFSPASLADLTYAFSSCRALTTILCDAGWELPKAGLKASQTFYSCTEALKGGLGTTWSKDAVSGEYLRPDLKGQLGYMTAV